MPMQQSSSPKGVQSREFTVSIIGATPNAMAAFSRIFSVTGYRIRAYKAVSVATNVISIPKYKASPIYIKPEVLT